MKLIDTNALIVLLIGAIDSHLIQKHKRTSIYEEQDYFDLLNQVGKKLGYFLKMTSEKFIESKKAIETPVFYDLGLTDSLLLTCAKECDLLITSDSSLSDYAVANGITVYDLVKNRNNRI